MQHGGRNRAVNTGFFGKAGAPDERGKRHALPNERVNLLLIRAVKRTAQPPGYHKQGPGL